MRRILFEAIAMSKDKPQPSRNSRGKTHSFQQGTHREKRGEPADTANIGRHRDIRPYGDPRGGISPAKRVYRRAAELPDPDQPRYAAVNRTTKQISISFDPDFLRRIEEVAKAEGKERNDWIKDVIAPHLEK